MTHGSITYSNHIPMILVTEGVAQNLSNRLKPFRFESMWIVNAECIEIIKESWPSYSDSDYEQTIMDNFKRCGERLRI